LNWMGKAKPRGGLFSQLARGSDPTCTEMPANRAWFVNAEISF
jgi:hypothetical protein